MPKKKSPLAPTLRARLLHGMRMASLPATVFLTGAAILVIEVVATRVLSPYFGNSIYTVSSVISVVLAALSVGYVVGGKFADKHPRQAPFYAIIAVSGICVLGMQLLHLTVVPKLGLSLPLTVGPLMLSLLLFFIPSFLMGMLSPYAVKLSTVLNPQTGIGSASGNMFFWSTLGSITGSLSAGFLLIPFFGVNAILVGTGCFLVALGLIPLLIAKAYRAAGVGLIFVILLTAIMPAQASQQVVYQKDGLYERIQIVDGTYQGRPTRFFMQDRSSSGAMFLDSDDLVYDYTKYYELYKLLKPDTKQALVIGGGVYSVPKALIKDIREVNVDVSEIEPSLPELSQKYFNLPNDARIQSHITDGRRMLATADKQYDFIFSDVYYSLYSIPHHFTTREFFELAKSRLTENGVFVANIIGDLSREQQSLTFSEIRTFQQAFPNSYFFAVDSPGSRKAQNLMFVGINSDSPANLNTLAQSADSEFLRTLPGKSIDIARYELSPYPILTDDFAPVDYLTAQTTARAATETSPHSSGNAIMAYIDQQLRYGPRYPGSQGHKKNQAFIAAELRAVLPQVTLQQWQDTRADKPQQYTNIIGRLNPDKTNRVILGAHYDTKRFADLDKTDPTAPLPGANDGASGVAVLLELAHSLSQLDQTKLPGIDFVFFDGEEGHNDLPSHSPDWRPLGSEYFATHIDTLYATKPQKGIVLDMVCEKHAQFRRDATSLQFAGDQTEQLWRIGQRISSEHFTVGTANIHDDHTPLNAIGIPATLIGDFDYAPYHTTEDTTGKCSNDTLRVVHSTVFEFLTKTY